MHEHTALMDENEFWNIISMFNWDHEGDDDKVLESAIHYLSSKPNEAMYRFIDILSKHLYDLDGIAYAKNIGEDAYVDENTYFSVDNFLYARCVVVANGKDYYNKVLNNPKLMPEDLEFEALLYVADEAYEIKNDETFEYVSAYDFETFSNKEQWVESK